MQHHATRKWEKQLKEIFHKIDEELEARWGGTYDLHPARPPKGATANPLHDGLFNVGAAFSAGYGSKHGRGYVVQIQIATLENVPTDVREKIAAFVVKRLQEILPTAFPDRSLHVSRDGNLYKIHGDLSLGQA